MSVYERLYVWERYIKRERDRKRDRERRKQKERELVRLIDRLIVFLDRLLIDK